MSLAQRTSTWRIAGVAASLAIAAACGDVNGALQRLSDARQAAADLRVEFTKDVDAGNRAVMADTDDASQAFAREADQARQAVEKDVARLTPMLQSLDYAPEMALLQDFRTRYATYGDLDRRILDLAVQNTNLKAQRLSFGSGRQEADAFRAALVAVAPAKPAQDRWQVQALVSTAVGAVRQIQVLQAPHIAERDDAVMTQLESEMAASEAEARRALTALGPLAAASSRAHMADASAALDRFMAVNAQVVVLSRRNTNVSSLALALDQKRTLTAPCEDDLRALQDALAKRGYPAGR